MEKKKQAQSKKMELRGPVWTIMSLALALNSPVFMIYLIYNGVSGLGFALAVAALLHFWWWVGLLLGVASIVLAIIGLKSKLRRLSIVVLCFDVIMVFAILCFTIWGEL